MARQNNNATHGYIIVCIYISYVIPLLYCMCMYISSGSISLIIIEFTKFYFIVAD